jgi:hypothetical protein
MIAEAKATAERIRSESERELAAATQRRDSINAQLTNVRQMLATLTGASLPDPLAGAQAEEDQAAEPKAAGEAPDEAGGKPGQQPGGEDEQAAAAAPTSNVVATAPEESGGSPTEPSAPGKPTPGKR